MEADANDKTVKDLVWLMERPPSIPPSPKSVSSKSGRSTLPQVQVHVHKLDPEIVDNEPIILEREG